MYKYLILVSFLTLIIFDSKSQITKSALIQVSGLIVGGDSLYGIPTVQVTNPGIKRTVFTNYSGFFSMPSYIGDTLSISMLGFKPKKYVVPSNIKNNAITVAITIYEDTVLYPVIEYFPYPTLKDFKKAFIAIGDNQSLYRFSSPYMAMSMMNKIASEQPMSAAQNNTYYLNSMVAAQQNRNMIQTTDFANPFAWVRFLKDLKKSKKSKKNESQNDQYFIDNQ